MTKTKGGIELPGSSEQKFSYGLVVSIGELCKRRHIETGADFPLKEGLVVHCNWAGFIPFETDTLNQGENAEGLQIARYENITSVLDKDFIRARGLHNFRDEMRLLKQGKLSELYASRSLQAS